MLLINRSGRIYDIPDKVAENYVAAGNVSREAVGDMLSTLRSEPQVSAESMQAAGCCNLYSNYCPNT